MPSMYIFCCSQVKEMKQKSQRSALPSLPSPMAATTSPLTFLCSSTQRKSKTTCFIFSPSAHLCPQTPQSRLSSSAPQLGHALSSQWNGLRRVGLSIKQKAVKIEGRGRCRRMVVYASLFGVGAPEALVIGVVALLVFGPKGLAEVARNLGKTLRSFQPTIRELQEVSREFKSTLEREIGLDDIPPTGQNSNRSAPTATSTDVNKENSQGTLDPNGVPAESNAQDGQSLVQDGEPTTEKPFNIGELLVEAQRKSLQQSQSAPPEKQAQPQPEAQPQEAAPTTPQPVVSEVPQPTVSEVPQPESQPQEAAPSTPQPTVSEVPQPTVSEVPPTTPQTKQESEA